MQKTLTEKLILNHLIFGNVNDKKKEIAIKIDQTLTQDATGTLACLQFESLNMKKIKTELSINYIDHNTLQTGFESSDDHKFLQSFSSKYNIYFSKPGNGICHQVHLERFAAPGKTLLGSDSHTSTSGAVGMLAIGAGGLDVAIAMAGDPFYLIVPKIINIKLKGKLKPYVSAKDIILKILQIISCKGAINKILEYSGEALKYLSIPERATICNMGAELGATSSIFPSDLITEKFLSAQKRKKDFISIKADENALYDETISIDLNFLEPLCAMPHSPDNIKNISEIKNLKIDQVIIGSCTNSSYMDLMKVANILKGRTISSSLSLSIAPGSKQVLEMLAENGALKTFISAGARILECACGPCIGMGQAPGSNSISLRTFNRNFKGRSGTIDSFVYLVSPETAAISSINGFLTDPKTIKINYKNIKPIKFLINDNLIIKPKKYYNYNINDKIKTIKGPNIKNFPINLSLTNKIQGIILLKLDDNINTDQIIPAGANILPLRSNIPKISNYCFYQIDPFFSKKAMDEKSSFILAGNNYGQGSSREHAALVPMYLGIKAILAKSFARIHRNNLINFGILPLVFENEKDYNKINKNDYIFIDNIKNILLKKLKIKIKNKTQKKEYFMKFNFSCREIKLLISGGLLNYTKNKKLNL